MTFVLAFMLAVAGCADREQNVITDAPPFYHHRVVTFSERESDRVIAEVRKFAEERGMDFLLSRDGPDAGDFNASANAPNLNIKAVHVKAVGGGLDIFAITRGTPTPEARESAVEFTCRVAKECRELR